MDVLTNLDDNEEVLLVVVALVDVLKVVAEELRTEEVVFGFGSVDVDNMFVEVVMTVADVGLLIVVLVLPEASITVVVLPRLVPPELVLVVTAGLA